MNTIILAKEASKLSKNLKSKGKRIVLVGGCFDVLHPGHVIFLEKARKAGDCLIVFLESDQKVRLLKGVNRPVHNQKLRAKVLSAIKFVDYIVMLPYLKQDSQYDELIAKIKPDVIAATRGDVSIHHRRSAKRVGAKLKLVTKIVGDHSTSKIYNKYS